ncbi:recombinase family protein [uncultured Desulfobacter sp.]|uniref:recombinase family protein n=1 Tax=uncultured Desulfobacter sp. TaxID=240139 RepID=UPI0029C7F1D6|nr:recombinase family protein [uncultured Desulfobacter sp.]
MAEVGYIRVSFLDQNTDRQLDGIPLDKIFEDKSSGKNINRPEYKACMEYLREGDRLHVHAMDRLARNLRDLQETVEKLTTKGIKVKFHAENVEFSGEDDPIAMLMLHLMGAVAQFERSLIKKRQAEGIAKALQKGKKFGRRPKLNPTQEREVVALVESGQEKTTVAKKFGISRDTVYRIMRDRKEGKISGLVECQLEL